MRNTPSVYLLFILLMAIGFILLIKAIRILRKSFAGDMIVEIPFSQKITEFEITKPGVYSIWQKGPYIRKMPVDEFKPILRERSANQEIKLEKPLFRPNAKNLNTIKMEIFRFTAEKGSYRLEIAPGTSISALERIISNLVPVKKAELNQYSLLVRQSMPFLCTLAGILLLVLSGFLIIGSLVLVILQRN